MGQISPEKLEAMRSIGFLSKGQTRPKVREWTDPTSGRMKAVTDELGNTVTQHSKVDRQDVHIKAPEVKIIAQQKEHRQ